MTTLADFTYQVIRRYSVKDLAAILQACQIFDYVNERLIGNVLLELMAPQKKGLYFFDDVLQLLETCARFELQEIDFLNHLAERTMQAVPKSQLP